MSILTCRSRLAGFRSYLCGPMEFDSTNGLGWRQGMGQWMQSKHGVTILDPACKPIDIGAETLEDKTYRAKLKAEENYDQIAKEMRLVRRVDLRLVDVSDFLIVHLDNRINTTGTHEEYGWSNRMKKPTLFHIEQGKNCAPDWLFGMFDHRHIFSTWDELKAYLNHVAFDSELDTEGLDKRWFFFYNSIRCPS